MTSRKDYSVVDYDYFKSMLSSMADELVKEYSKNIRLDCTPDKSSIYIEDSVNIICTLDNVGDKSFNVISICLDDNCTTRNLAVQKIQLSYSKRFESEV